MCLCSCCCDHVLRVSLLSASLGLWKALLKWNELLLLYVSSIKKCKPHANNMRHIFTAELKRCVCVRMFRPLVCLWLRSLSYFLQPQPFTLMWPSTAALCLPPHLYVFALLWNISPLLSPIFSHFPASHSSFDCQLALLAAASFFDPPLLTQSLNTFNLLSSFLICHSIHPVLPFIISPYLPLPSVLLLAVSLSEGWIQGSSFSILSITHTHIPHALTAKCVCRLHMLILIYACFFVISCFCMKLLCVHSCQCV